MADNIAVTPGSGAIVATRTLTVNGTSGIEVPYGILGYESSGTFVAVAAAQGLPVSVLGTVPVSLASLPALAAGSNTIGAVNQAGSWTVTANAGSGTFTVGGTVAATQSGNWSARAQDGAGNALTSLAPGSQRALTVAVVDGSGNQVTSFGGSGGTASNFSSAFPSTGTAAGASDGTNMKPLLVDGSGFLKVNASAGTVAATQSGSWTVTANAGTNLNTSALALESGGNLATIAAAVSSSKMQVNVTNTSVAVTGTFWQSTQPVSLASLPALAAGTSTIGYVNAIPSGDTIEIGGTTYSVLNGFANATASGENTLIAGVSGKKFKILSFSIGPVSVAVNVYFDGATDGAVSPTFYFAANGGMARSFNPFGHVVTATNNQALRLNLSTSANVPVMFQYIQF